MLRSPIALILGAGASRDFGANENALFPLGDDLRLQIASALNIQSDDWSNSAKRGSKTIFAAYRMVSKLFDDPALKVGNLAAAGKDISTALPGCESIDDLLERHSGNSAYEIAGKLGIVECILTAERRSPLRQNPERIEIPSIGGYSHHWMRRLLSSITRGCKSQSELGSTFSNLKVVNFNYDRCFEWFTFLWVRHVYNLHASAAWEVLRAIQIIHPYGSLGQLPDGSSGGVPFGYDPNPQDLVEMFHNILTYSESVDEDKRPQKIADLLDECSEIIFLGFAFHAQNMSLLDLRPRELPRSIYATTVGLPEPRWETARRAICQSLHQSKNSTTITNSSASCDELVLHYADRWGI